MFALLILFIADLASSRLQAILNACLIRRKKDSVLDGKKLIELPPKDVVLRKLTFSQDERDIYDAVGSSICQTCTTTLSVTIQIEKQSQAIINKYLRAGTVLKVCRETPLSSLLLRLNLYHQNYSHVLVLLLRLRQLCSHPCLIQEGGDAFLRPEDNVTVKHEVQTELDRATILAGQKFVGIMKAKFNIVTEWGWVATLSTFCSKFNDKIRPEALPPRDETAYVHRTRTSTASILCHAVAYLG